jgi:type II secretion system protein G
MAKLQPKQTGFTIVELLIVIVIIAILATISLVAYNGVQQRARDTQRMSDIHQIAKAIELYHADNGDLPRTSGWCTQISNPTSGYAAAFQGDIAPYLPSVPLDPLFKNTYQDYFYKNIDDQTFYLYAELEGSDMADDGLSACNRIGGLNNEYDYRYPAF